MKRKPKNRDFFLSRGLLEMPYNLPTGSDIAFSGAMPCVFAFRAFCGRFWGFFNGQKYVLFSA
jgi:hypothetical protein